MPIHLTEISSMKKSVVLFLILISSLTVNARDSTLIKNTLSLEVGLWHRGLLGLSYSHNFLKTEYTFCSVEAYGGLGISWERPNGYAGISTILNIGKGSAFFSMGIDLKYYSILKQPLCRER